MNRTVQLHPFSVLVGLGIAVLAFVTMAQSGDLQGTQNVAVVGSVQVAPHPRDMVSLDSSTMAVPTGAGNVTIPAQGSLHLISVPTDRWLVVTSFYQEWSSHDVRLVEDLGGTLTDKLNLEYPGIGSDGSGLGLVFSPGSNCILTNSSAAKSGRFLLLGYFVSDM